MATPNRYIVYLGGVLVGSSWSLHAANEKLTAAVLIRAHERGSFPVDGQVFSNNREIELRHFAGFMSSDSEDSHDS